MRQEYNVSVSGATDRSTFYASFGYLNNEGITENSNMERYTARLKADYQAKKWLKVGANAGYANFTYNSSSETPTLKVNLKSFRNNMSKNPVPLKALPSERSVFRRESARPFAFGSRGRVKPAFIPSP